MREEARLNEIYRIYLHLMRRLRWGSTRGGAVTSANARARAEGGPSALIPCQSPDVNPIARFFAGSAGGCSNGSSLR